MDNFDLRKYLIENKLTYNSNLSEVSISQLKSDFVDTGRIKDKDFNEILKATGDDSALSTWLVARVVGSKKIKTPIIKVEDIYKYKEYFNVFRRHKNKYELKDINQIKDKSQLQDFIIKSIELGDAEKEDPSKQKGVSKSDKYNEFKLAEVNGFDIYKIPKGRKDLYNASCELGSGTQWCTATGRTSSYYEQYIESGDLYVIISKSDPKEKYQFHYATNSFMDKTDMSIFGDGMPY